MWLAESWRPSWASQKDAGLSAPALLRAAALALRQLGALHLVAALPVITPALRVALEPAVDALVGAITLEPGGDDVRDWYADLTPPADAKVAALLEQAARRVAPRLRERNA